MRKRMWGLAIATILLLIVIRPFLALALTNYGQLERLIHDKSSADISSDNLWPFKQAFDLWPSNFHVRMQYGSALLASGNSGMAYEVLAPISNQSRIEEPAYGVFISALMLTQPPAVVFEYVESHNLPSTIAPQTAASLSKYYLDNTRSLRFVNANYLLSKALALETNSNDLKLLITQVISQPNSVVINQLNTTLDWFVRLKSNNKSSSIQRDDQFENAVVRQLLSNEQMSLGPNHISNGEFDTTVCDIIREYSCQIGQWLPSYMTNNLPWNAGVFVIGIDKPNAISGSGSLRIDGIVLEDKPKGDPARAGLWHSPISISPNTCYLVSFFYRTESVDTNHGASVWLSGDTEFRPNNDIFLPATNSKWRSVSIVFWNQTNQQLETRPLLRSFSTGTVWFDDFSIREIHRTDGQPIPPRDPIINIRPID